MISTLIIDDEALIRDTLQKMLKRACPEVLVTCMAANMADGINAIRQPKPDLVLLDLHLAVKDRNAVNKVFPLYCQMQQDFLSHDQT